MISVKKWSVRDEENSRGDGILDSSTEDKSSNLSLSRTTVLNDNCLGSKKGEVISSL